MPKNNKKYRGVLFDLDGVIVDTTSLYERCQCQVLLNNKISISGLNWWEYAGNSSLEIFRSILSKRGIFDVSAETLDQQFNKIFLSFFVGLVRVSDGTIDILTFLKNKNVKTGVVTSSRRDVTERILKRFDLLQYFDLVVCAEDVKNKKPSPEPYIFAVNKLKLKISECLAVEDSERGLISAHQAKLDCAMIGIAKDKSSTKFKTVFFAKNFKALNVYLRNRIYINKYTIFTIKKDALERGIKDNIIKDISKFYTIENIKEIEVTKKMVAYLKENEWKKNWKPYPSKEVRQLCYNYESGKIIVLLCRINSLKDAIEFGKGLKGRSHLPHLCDKKTIRGKYADNSILNRLYQDKLNISYLMDENGRKISIFPNIMHAVDNKLEFDEHFSLYFNRSKLID